MSNHLDLMLRSRPDVVLEWSPEEVAHRWLMLCPERRDENCRPLEPTEFEINRIVDNTEKLAGVRSRRSDISWWMRRLCQNITQRAKREVGEIWQSRYRAVRRLDEIAILSCAASLELNSIRVAMSQTIAASKLTSGQKRSLDLTPGSQNQTQPESAGGRRPSWRNAAVVTKNYRSDGAMVAASGTCGTERTQWTARPRSRS